LAAFNNNWKPPPCPSLTLNESDAMVNFEQFKKSVVKLGLGEEFSEEKLRSLHRDFLRTQGGWGLDEDVLKEVSVSRVVSQKLQTHTFAALMLTFE
jgi:hypothetical protein